MSHERDPKPSVGPDGRWRPTRMIGPDARSAELQAARDRCSGSTDGLTRMTSSLSALVLIGSVASSGHRSELATVPIPGTPAAGFVPKTRAPDFDWTSASGTLAGTASSTRCSPSGHPDRAHGCRSPTQPNGIGARSGHGTVERSSCPGSRSESSNSLHPTWLATLLRREERRIIRLGPRWSRSTPARSVDQ